MSSNYELNPFGYLVPSSVSDAVSMLTKYGGDAKVMGGGTDLLYLMKNHVEMHTPKYLVDISPLNLNKVSYNSSSGLTIGATTPLATIMNDQNVQKYYAAIAGATSGHPSQMAAAATAAGNISQEVWCWYLRNNLDCWRNGGNVCYAINGDNRYYHSIFGGNLCYAVHASDLATALFAHNATLTVAGPNGNSTKTMDQFMPGISTVDGIVKENSLRYNEIITAINVPAPASGTLSTFFRMTDRGAIDFPLATASVVAEMSGSTVKSARIYMGHVATKPIRASGAESAIVNQSLPIAESTIATAAANAVKGATPLTSLSTNAAGVGHSNKFRVWITQGVVANAIRALNTA
ncbi:MAG: FAD binding domain-containing protein [Nitrososphaerota archaeon]|jgi:xanthine dehydrogenase YagS FAD-binding subunit|nr:FAD binding domain-containing protein [Nitrososphaerota archaeon]